MPTRSTTPRKSDSAPIGSWRTSGVELRRSTIMSTQLKKSAPVRSSLLTKHIRGTAYLFAWRHTVIVCGSTPATPSKTATAPPSTRSERPPSAGEAPGPGGSGRVCWGARPAGEDRQPARHLGGGGGAARGVDDVELVGLPPAGGRGGGDGDAPLLLLLH